MKTVTVWFRSIALGLSVLTASAFAGNYQDRVTTSSGPSYSSNTVYGVPSGAFIEADAFVYGSTGYASYSVNGAGVNWYSYTGSSNHYVFDTATSTGGDVSYAIVANSASYPDYAESLIVISW